MKYGKVVKTQRYRCKDYQNVFNTFTFSSSYSNLLLDLGTILIESVYLLIPKNLGDLLEKDTNYYISINEMYYSQEENVIKPAAYFIEVTDEAYTDFIDLLAEYNYHGFWQSLWPKTSHSPDVYYITNDDGKGFVIDNHGNFYLKRNDKSYTYYLG